ncbi:hypothetical protein FV139_17300 [Parahaliea maris]|uniref:Translocation and assembly module TamB C-terminal domain-containing protein n=1 Tax=Parahaliea maris TaxID=2716870 RepID=A0A5C8ZTF4_9GAMM|nr:translocation/assembly module TamB domain-containing protein [Parahaliea maris]TXS90737.1 hypothetical protein FV139_17300 [Parahaliea maris]
MPRFSKKWLFLPLAGLLLLPLLAAVCALWLGSTEAGTRWLVARAQPFIPEGVHWQSLDGTLLGDLRLRGLSVEQPGLSLSLALLDLRWQPSRLLGAQVLVEQLRLQTLRASLSETDTPESPSAPFDPEALNLPVDLLIQHLVVEDVDVMPVGGEAQRIDRLQLENAGLTGPRFDLQRLVVVAPQGGITAEGGAELTRDLPLTLTLDWEWQLPDQRQVAGRLAVSGDLRTLQIDHRGAGDIPINLQAQVRDVLTQAGWTVSMTWPELAVDATADGPRVTAGQFRSTGSLEAFELALNTGATGLAPEAVTVTLEASGNSESLLLAPLTLDSGPYQLEVKGPIDWRDGVSVQLALAALVAEADQLNPQLPPQLDLSGSLNARYLDQRVELAGLDLALAQTPLTLALQGTVDLPANADPVVDARLAWSQVTWPLPGPAAPQPAAPQPATPQPATPQPAAPPQETGPAFASPRGELHVQGGLQQWRLALDAAVAGSQLPPGEWRAEAEGDAEQLRLDALRGSTLEGEVVIQGEAGWAPQVRWDMALAGDALQPGTWQPQLAGQMDFALHSAGSLEEGGPQADLVLEHLRGFLGGWPLSARARAQLAGDVLNLEGLSVDNGSNRIQAAGKLSPQALALDWSLALPHPENIVPEAAGDLHANGSLRGSAEAPVIEATLQGSALHWQDITLAGIDGQLGAGLAPAAPLAVKLSLGPVEQDGMVLLESVEFTAQGSTAQHELQLAVQGAMQQLQTRLAGGLNDSQQWQGQLASLEVAAEGLGQWRLVEPADLVLAAQQASLADACLGGSGDSEGSACLSAGWSATEGSRARGHIASLPLGQWLPDLEAELSGDFDGLLAVDGSLQGLGDFVVSPGEVRVETSSGQKVLAHGGGRVRVDVGAEGLAAFASLYPLENGYVGLTVALPSFDRLPLTQPQPLSGSLQATLPELSGLQAWVPQLQAVAGRFDADLLLSGTLTEPLFKGQIALADGAADVPVAGLSLRELGLRLNDDPARPGWLAIDGGLRSGPGQLTLSGALGMRSGEASLALQGQQFEVFNTADGRALVSPDLQIDWAGETLRLRGEVLVPRASVTPQISITPSLSAGGAVATEEDIQATVQVIGPSPDVVVLGAEDDPSTAGPALPFRLDSDLRLVLGDRVRVDAVGLKAGVTGGVRFINRPEQRDLLPLADGQLALEDGTFRAFGQDLEIQTGEVRFDKVPVTEPEINLRAVRWIDNDPVVSAAGIEVIGTLDQPRMDLFSRPLMDPTEIQSYLLTGSSASGSDRVLGIGTYLHPKLYVGYGYNLLEETSEFDALYTITPRYGIEANLGEADNNLNLTITYER